MKKKQIEQLKEIIKEEEKQYNFHDFVLNYIDDEDLNDIEDLTDLEIYLEGLNSDNELTDSEIIYYSNAIEYLQNNDPSFQESLRIASELGYNIKDLNSELLASLLSSETNKEDYITFISSVLLAMKEVF